MRGLLSGLWLSGIRLSFQTATTAVSSKHPLQLLISFAPPAVLTLNVAVSSDSHIALWCPPPSRDLLESSSKRLGANVDCGRIKLPWPGHFTKQSPNETFSLHNVLYVAPQAVKFLM